MYIVSNSVKILILFIRLFDLIHLWTTYHCMQHFQTSFRQCFLIFWHLWNHPSWYRGYENTNWYFHIGESSQLSPRLIIIGKKIKSRKLQKIQMIELKKRIPRIIHISDMHVNNTRPKQNRKTQNIKWKK